MKTRARKLVRRLAPEAKSPLSPALAFGVQFREEAAAEGNRFAGRVEHMVTGQAARFESPDDLVAFLARVLRAAQTKLSDEGSSGTLGRPAELGGDVDGIGAIVQQPK